MRLVRSKKLAAGIGAAALLSGGAGAFAATQLGSNPRQAYINDVASRLHVTPTALTSAMKAARIDQIDAAEKAGKLTAAQASAVKSWIRSGQASGGAGGPGFFGKPGPGGGFGPGAVKSPHGRFACAAPPMQTTTTGTGTTSTSTTKTFKSAPPCAGGPPNGPGRFRLHGWSACAGPPMSTTTTATGTTTTATGTTTTSTTNALKAAPHCFAGPPNGFKGSHRPGFWSGAALGPGARLGLRARLAFGIGLAPRLLGIGAKAVTTYLGITPGTLRSDLASGKTIAQITSTASKSLSGLESAVSAAIKTKLDKAVSAGKITSAEEAKVLSAVSSRLSKLVNMSFKIPAVAPLRHARTH